MKFKFTVQNDEIGGVTVHTHHSNRLIQIQGRCIMPDNNSGAVWFAKVVLQKFREQAKIK